MTVRDVILQVAQVLAVLVLALAVGMSAWLSALDGATVTQFGIDSARQMHDGLLLVPLTAKFAFISPSMLVIVMPLLALLPIVLVLASRRFAIRRVPVWYGGVKQDVARTATTALTFSNALRTFYSFIYRPTIETTRESTVVSTLSPACPSATMSRRSLGPICLRRPSGWCAPPRIGCARCNPGLSTSILA